MSGLPRVPSTLRKRLVWEAMVLSPIERLTERLMRGDEIPEEDLRDMHDLRRRFFAFSAALDAREKAAGITVLDTERTTDHETP